MPEKINSGTAIRTCLFIASNAICIRVDHGRFSPQMAAIELPNPKTRKIGTDKNNRINEKITAKENITYNDFHKFLEK
tara:strand:- start:188 stop:421 length:234 start_codon:yes stop_codon:yes gene_type:complete